VIELGDNGFVFDGLKYCSNYKVHKQQMHYLFIKLDKVLKFTLKIILTCSYMFRSTTIIRESSLKPS